MCWQVDLVTAVDEVAHEEHPEEDEAHPEAEEVLAAVLAVASPASEEVPRSSL